MEDRIHLTTPLRTEVLEKLHIGDRVLISGTIFSARDAAHQRLVRLILNHQRLPVQFSGQIMYYMGPSPAKPGQAIGAAGPTSSYRMDPYTPALIETGLKGMIGKGARSEAVKSALREHKAVYFAAIGGAGALISKCILEAEIVAYPDLGTEALRRLRVRDFPVLVANDIYGGDLFEQGVKDYAREPLSEQSVPDDGNRNREKGF